MINGIQIRMARSALGWSVHELAKKSQTNPNTISRIENGANALNVTLIAIEKTLTEAGVIFIPENGDGVGVRLRKK